LRLVVLSRFLGGIFKECPAGEGFEHPGIIAGFHVFDESPRLKLKTIQDL
jgi:hypothetical protein